MKFFPKSPQSIFDELGTELFKQLRAASRENQQDFTAKYLPMIERVALTLQEAPLTRESFAESLGALRFALRSSLMAMRLCDGVIFTPDASSSERMSIEPQYRYAAFAASLASAPIIANHNVLITINNQPWSWASGQRLYDAAHGLEYEVAWLPKTPKPPPPMLALVLLHGIYNTGQFAHFSKQVLYDFCEAINPNLQLVAGESSLTRTVRQAQERVKEQEATRVHQLFTASNTPTSIEAIDADGVISTSTTAVTPADSNSPKFGRTEVVSEVQLIKNTEITDWIKVASLKMASEIELRQDGRVLVSKKALAYGIGASAMYEMVQKAGLVVERTEGGFIGTDVLAKEFAKHIKV